MTLLVAGHETTASSLAWAFERLARQPAGAGRLVDEIDVDDGDAYLTRHDPGDPAPPAGAPERRSRGWSRSRSRSAAGSTRPGVCLVPNAYLVHHDPEIYPDPYEFRPERFLDEPPGTYTWIPFGGGRRRCIGASFAMLEMQIVTPHRARRAASFSRAGRRRARLAAQHHRPTRARGAVTALGERRPAAVAAG